MGEGRRRRQKINEGKEVEGEGEKGPWKRGGGGGGLIGEREGEEEGERGR